MSAATFHGVIENGQVKMPQHIHVPERTKVYIVVPDADRPAAARILSPRLAAPKQARDFKLTVLPNAGA